MSSMPSVTVVTVYYNRQDFVVQSVQSLLDQSYPNLRVIAVDDSSTDGTLEALRAITSDRLEVRTQANKGFTRTIRDTLEGIDSDYIAIHGSGDLSYPERIARQVEALEAHPDAPLCAVASRDYDPVRQTAIGVERHTSPSISRDDLWSAPPFTHGAVMYRASDYHRAGGYNPAFAFCQDWDLWFNLLEDGNGVFVDEVLYDRLNHGDGATFNPRKAILQLRNKAAVLAVARLPRAQRAAARQAIADGGLDELIVDSLPQIHRDLATRSIKLDLMGRRSEADQIRDFLKAAKPNRVSTPLRLAMHASSVLSQSGLPVSALMQAARQARKVMRR